MSGSDRPDRAQLIVWAVCALEDVLDAAAEGPVAPGFALKAILGFLFACGRGNRAPYQAFWREIQKPHGQAWSDGDRRYLRFTYANTALTGIVRDLGMEGPLLDHRVHRARHGPPEHESTTYLAMIERLEQEEAAAAAARPRRDCGFR